MSPNFFHKTASFTFLAKLNGIWSCLQYSAIISIIVYNIYSIVYNIYSISCLQYSICFWNKNVCHLVPNLTENYKHNQIRFYQQKTWIHFFVWNDIYNLIFVNKSNKKHIAEGIWYIRSCERSRLLRAVRFSNQFSNGRLSNTHKTFPVRKPWPVRQPRRYPSISNFQDIIIGIPQGSVLRGPFFPNVYKWFA